MNIKQLFKDNFSFSKLFLYMFRWQLSTPILGFVTYLMTTNNSGGNSFSSAFVANLIGSLIFFWVDILIFSKKN